MKKKCIAVLTALTLAGVLIACNSKTKTQPEPVSSENPSVPGEGKDGQADEEAEENSSQTEDNGDQDTKGNDSEEAQKKSENNSAKEAEMIQWFNTAYAGITKVNGGDISLMGGFAKDASHITAIKQALESSWDVTDKKSAEENLKWLLEEGHRKSFQAEMEQMEEEGYFELPKADRLNALLESGLPNEQAACYEAAMKAYDKMGKNAIDAWDYCRALQLLGWYYVADYYTEEEVLNQSADIAKKLQTSLSSWDELIESYMAGYNYWQEEDPKAVDSETAKRQAVFDELKSGSDNPYVIDWNLNFD